MDIAQHIKIFSLFLACFIGVSAHGQEADWHKKRDLGNFLSKRAGAKIVSCSGTDSTNFMVHNIIDATKGEEATWRVRTLDPKKRATIYPQWVVIELPSVEVFSSMAFATDHITGKQACPRNISIEFSTESDSSGYKKVAYETIPHNKPFVYVSLPNDYVRWIRIKVSGNWGNPYFMEMGRVYAYNDVSMDNFEELLRSNKKLDLHNIYFESGNAIIKQESLPVIEMLAYVLQNNADWEIAIEGHTDGDGSHHHNLTLSQRRAEAVLDALVVLGINRKRLKAVGKGEHEKKVVEEKTEEDKAMNRRVVISLERMNAEK